MKKLFAVAVDIRLVVLAEDEDDACDIAQSTLRRVDCDGEVAQAGMFATEITTVGQLQPGERGSLPWDRRAYDREEGEDVTCEQLLRQAKLKDAP